MKGPSLAEVRERDWNRCANCGSSRDLHVHHRLLRSQGGPSTFSNQVTLCQQCHSYCHANPETARAAALILRRGDDPELTPIAHFCWPATLVYLKDDGTIAFYGQKVGDQPEGWRSLPTHDRK